eukprot:s284_g17.t1
MASPPRKRRVLAASEASPSEVSQPAMEFYRESDVATVDTKLLVAQYSVAAEKEGFTGVAQQEKAVSMVLKDLVAKYEEARAGNDLKQLSKITIALRDLAKKGNDDPSKRFLLRRTPTAPKIPGVARAIETEAVAAMISKGAFTKSNVKLLSEQQQVLNEALTRQQNSAPDGAFFWRLVLAHEDSGPFPMVKTEEAKAAAEKLFETIASYCASNGTRQGCALRRSQGLGMLQAPKAAGTVLSKDDHKIVWNSPPAFMQRYIYRLLDVLPFQDDDNKSLWETGLKYSSDLAVAGPRIAHKSGPGLRHRLTGNKSKDDCMELILREVARLLQAFDDEKFADAIKALGETARVQLEKQKYERHERAKLDQKIRSYYETDATISVLLSMFAQQVMKRMVNALEADDQEGVESWFLFHHSWINSNCAKLVRWRDTITQERPVRVLMLGDNIVLGVYNEQEQKAEFYELDISVSDAKVPQTAAGPLGAVIMKALTGRFPWNPPTTGKATKRNFRKIKALVDLVVEESFSPLARLLNGDIVRMNHFMSSGSPWHSLGTTLWWAYVLMQALDPDKSATTDSIQLRFDLEFVKRVFSAYGAPLKTGELKPKEFEAVKILGHYLTPVLVGHDLEVRGAEGQVLKLLRNQAILKYPKEHTMFPDYEVLVPTLGTTRLALCMAWPLTRTSEEKATSGDIVAARAASLLLEGGFAGASAGVREALLASLESNVASGVRLDTLNSQLTGLVYNDQMAEDEHVAKLVTEEVLTFAKQPNMQAFMRLFHPTISIEGLHFRRNYRLNSLLSTEVNEAAKEAGVHAPKRAPQQPVLAAEMTVDANLFGELGVVEASGQEETSALTKTASKKRKAKLAVKQETETTAITTLFGKAIAKEAEQSKKQKKRNPKKVKKDAPEKSVSKDKKHDPAMQKAVDAAMKELGVPSISKAIASFKTPGIKNREAVNAFWALVTDNSAGTIQQDSFPPFTVQVQTFEWRWTPFHIIRYLIATALIWTGSDIVPTLASPATDILIGVGSLLLFSLALIFYALNFAQFAAFSFQLWTVVALTAALRATDHTWSNSLQLAQSFALEIIGLILQYITVLWLQLQSVLAQGYFSFDHLLPISAWVCSDFPQRDCVPGPNSRGTSKPVRWLLYLLLVIGSLFMMTTDQSWCWGEGSGSPMGSREALLQVLHKMTPLSAKSHGLGPYDGAKPTETSKRSFYRACRRSLVHGHAWYKGLCLTPDAFPVALRDSIAKNIRNEQIPPGSATDPLVQSSHVQNGSQHPTSSNHVQSPKHRIRFFQWNPSGLSSARYQELIQWLSCQSFDVVCLAETKWRPDLEWQLPDWTCVHTGHSDGNAGVLILVSRRLCPSPRLSWQTIHAGRLLHIRLHIGLRHYDVIGLYQWPHTAANKLKRQALLNQLDQLLDHIPRRNQLALLGDFNTALNAFGGAVGTSQYTWNGSRTHGARHTDSGALEQVLQKHDLCALNTWNSSDGPTFHGPLSTSRIDYIMCRQRQVDCMAKITCQLINMPMLPASGFHVPLVATIQKCWIPYKSVAVDARFTMRHRLLSRQLHLAQDSQWLDMLAQTQVQLHRLHVDQIAGEPAAPALNADCDAADLYLKQMHAVLSTFFATFMHPDRLRPLHRQPPVDEFHAVVQNKWHYWKTLRSLHTVTLSNLFQAWSCWSKFHALQKTQVQTAKQCKIQKIQELTQRAAAAAQRNDLFGLYHLVNKFTPKQRRSRIQLRTHIGTIASPAEEMSILRAFVQKTWFDPDALQVLPLCTPTIPGVPFTEEELTCELQKAPILKAVASPYPPNLMWRANAAQIAAIVYRELNRWWHQWPPHVPTEWQKGWLVFIGKPGKPPTQPGNLRALAMQEPVGKSILSLLTRRLQSAMFSELSTWPQMAYMAFRDTQDALLRVVTHCQQVHALVRSQSSSLWNQRAGNERLTCYGGLQLFVDLERAFDTAPRDRIIQALQMLQVPDGLIGLIGAWHDSTSYVLSHHDMSDTLPTNRGVRQGCVAAPALWSSLMYLLMIRYSHWVPAQWIRNFMTIFADDIHLCHMIHNAQDMQQAIDYFGFFFTCAQDLGLTINFRKNGSHAAALGRHIFARLKIWLSCNSKISIDKRYQLWQATVFTTMIYGIFTVGLTHLGLKSLQIEIMRQLRIMAGDFPQLTALSHQSFLHHRRWPSPARMLLTRVEGMIARLDKRRFTLAPDDIVMQFDWQHLHSTAQLLRQAMETDPTTTALHSVLHPFDHHVCYFCPPAFANTKALKRHMCLVHSYSMRTFRAVHFSKDSTDGMPHCRFCSLTFSTWQLFARHMALHVERVDTQAALRDLEPHLSAQPAPSAVQMALTPASSHDVQVRSQPRQPDVSEVAAPQTRSPLFDVARDTELGARTIQLIKDQNWQGLKDDEPAKHWLCTHCIVCNVYVGTLKRMNSHMRQNHAAHIEGLIQLAGIVLKRCGTVSPCEFCYKTFQNEHLCPAIIQASVILLHEMPSVADSEQAGSAPVASGNLRRPRRLIVNDFVLARDSVHGDAKCNLCQRTFGTLNWLRLHIALDKCPHFDVSKSQTPIEPNALMLEHLRTGQLMALGEDAFRRLQWTCHCQTCGVRFTGASNVANHMQAAHSELWHAATTCAAFLNAYVRTVHPCVCNPSPGVVRPEHQCMVLRQVAMQYVRARDAGTFLGLFLPYEISVADLSSYMPHAPEGFCALLHANLQTPHMDAFWDSSYIPLVLDRCLLCGLEVSSDLAGTALG